MSKIFNIILSGIGGQGLITLSRIIAEAAILEKKDVKISELHGLSQRGGSVIVQIRIGKNIYSPLIPRGKANLILVLELEETLKNCYFASKKSGTVFLINNQQIFSPTFEGQKLPSGNEILKTINKFSKKTILVDAAEVVKKEIGTEVVAGIFMISYTSLKKLIPIKPDSILEAIKKTIPEKYLDINLKAFNLAKKY